MVTAALNSGDTAWVLISTALVVLMTIPGLALFYSGLVKKENVLNTLFLSFAAYAVVSVIWFIYGYEAVFGVDIHGIIGLPANPFIHGVLESHALFGTIPLGLYAVFQMAFAAITVALISGAVVERIKFGAWMLFIPLWLTLVYLPVAHWVWGGGWLAQLGVLDFAGGIVVHINSGVAALALVLLLRPRQDKRMLPHQLAYTMLGAGLLWVGWFGFNAGSALAAGQLATSAFIVTNTSAAVGLLVWMLIEYVRFGKVTLLGAASGAICGLAAITPAAGYVNVASAMIIGFGAAVVSYAAISFIKPRLGYDDALDVFGIHGFSGICGVLAVGLFASPFINAAGIGLLYGNPHQLAVQALAIAATFAYSFVVTLIIAKSIDLTIGLHVGSSDEAQGLDLATHDEVAYRI